MDLNKKTFFITGATGFFGKYCLNLLVDKYPGANFKILIHKTNISLDFLNKEVVRISLDDINGLEGSLRGVDTIIHFAAATHSSDPKNYFKVNVSGTENLVTAAARVGVKKFIFISSRAIKPECGDYAKSKMEAEKNVIASGIPYLILRFSEIYSGDSQEGIGTLIKFVQKLPIIFYPAGKILLSPLFIRDAAGAVIKAVEKEELYNKTFVLAGPRNYLLKEIIELIAKSLSRHPILIPMPIFLVKIVTGILRMFKIRILQYDQIDRLICEKDDNINEAIHRLEFNPTSFEENLEMAK